MVKAFGGLLLAIGVLIAGLSGLCSLSVIGSGGFGQDTTGMLPMVAVFGGIPFLVGLAMCWGGWVLLRRNRP